MRLSVAPVEMTYLLQGKRGKDNYNCKNNRGSFDCVTHDEAVGHFAQDDNFSGVGKEQTTTTAKGGPPPFGKLGAKDDNFSGVLNADYLIPMTMESGPMRCSTRVEWKPASRIQAVQSAPV
jgi:hypothetical protein